MSCKKFTHCLNYFVLPTPEELQRELLRERIAIEEALDIMGTISFKPYQVLEELFFEN